MKATVAACVLLVLRTNYLKALLIIINILLEIRPLAISEKQVQLKTRNELESITKIDRIRTILVPTI